MIELETKKHYTHYGHTALELTFFTEIKFVDDDGLIKYIFEVREGNNIELVMSLKSLFERKTNKLKYEEFKKFYIEQYKSLEDCIDSKYYNLFIKVDTVINNYIDEIYIKMDDTKLTGIRFSSIYHNHQLTSFIETCVDLDCDNICYYIQITYTNGLYHYSITDKSIYLRIEMNDDYYKYYKDTKVNYYLSTDNILDLEKELYLKDYVLKDKRILDMYIKQLKY